MTDQAACYVRSSKDRADVSLQAQMRELEQLATKHDLTITTTYEDAVESGASESRPGFDRLLAAMRDRKRGWKFLLIYDSSRIARRRYIAQAFKHEARKYGITIYYCKMPADLDPITSVVVEAMMEAFDEMHSLMSRDKALGAMRENVRQGWRAGGRAPLGYRLEHHATGAVRDGRPVQKSRLTPGPLYPKVAEYLRRRAAGEQRGRVLADLGVDWKQNSMVDVERNALVYAGHTVWNRVDRPRTEWQIQRETHPALIDDVTAEQILARLHANSRGRAVAAGKRAMSNYLLAEVLVTSDGRHWRADGPHYRLAARDGIKGRMVRREIIEAAVLARLAQDLATDAFLEQLVVATRKSVGVDRSHTLRREIGRLEREKERASRLAIECDDPSPWVALVAERSDQIAVMRKEIDQFAAEAAAPAALRTLTVAGLRQMLVELDSPAALVRGLVARVVLDPNYACQIEYRTPSQEVRCLSMASPRDFDRCAPAAISPLRLAGGKG